MTTTPVKDQIIQHLDRLTQDQQSRVLDFMVNLSRPPGTPSDVLLKFAGAIPPEQLDQMEKAIEDCEKVDLSEW